MGHPVDVTNREPFFEILLTFYFGQKNNNNNITTTTTTTKTSRLTVIWSWTQNLRVVVHQNCESFSPVVLIKYTKLWRSEKENKCSDRSLEV